MMGIICTSLSSKILQAAFFLISLPLWLSAQEGANPWKLLYRVERPVELLAADPLGQVYVVTPQQELIQYNSRGAVAYNYQNFRHGKLGWVDAGNPLNILLYYPEFGHIIVLDRTLSEIAQLNLPEQGFWDAPVAGRSADNQIWIYDPVQTLIRKINIRGEMMASGQPLFLLLPQPPQPVWILEQNQEVFMYDPELGVLVFDPFGQYVRTVPLGAAEGVPILGERQLQSLRAPEPAKRGLFQAGRLILQTETGFAVYTL
jgi:hypothetical protein